MCSIMSASAKGFTGRYEVVNLPPTGESVNYASYRAPLKSGRLLKLPVGSVQPKGWMLKMLQLQSKGLNGQLGTVSAWLDKRNNQWLSDKGDHGWEEVPYWLRGYCSTAYILNDKAMEQEAKIWFESVLRNQKSDGFLGPRNTSNHNPEVWAQMIMLWAMQTYYEHSHDQRVLDAMTRYFHWELKQQDEHFLNDYWENSRGGDNMWSVIWLYNRTGDKSLLPLIDKLHRNTANWMQADNLPNWHGVNVAQGIREPATYYLYNGDSTLIKDSYRDFNIIRKRYGQVPGGMYGADENARKGYGDPRQGTETCALVEQMATDEIMMGITGDPFWADHCEDVAFNMLPAAFMPDMRSLRYLTSPNMAISDGKLHYPSIQNNVRGMLAMNPFSSRCCQHNHGFGWPYYIEHLVMATTDNGLATMLYGESQTTALVGNKQKLVLTQETHYPFDGYVKMTLNMDKATTFPLYLRIPSWAQGASVKVNGKKVKADNMAGKYLRIECNWKDGDCIELSLPMEITTREWASNKHSISINYGPLTLSLKIKENFKKRDSRDHELVQDDSHWQENANPTLWPAWEILPESAWNYSLQVNSQLKPINLKVIKRPWPVDANPFTTENVPLLFEAKGRIIPSWGYDQTGMTDVLPAENATRNEKVETIQLIPMGAARLRISAFPKDIK